MNWYIEAGMALKEVGIPVGVFILLCWLIIYIVKRLVKSMDDLIADNKVFFTHVRKEHENHNEHHQALMSEHRDIQKNLQETAIVLARINGFKNI